MRRTHEFRGRSLAIAMLAIALLGAAPSRAHEPDAEEIALGSLVDAELAFAKASATQGVRAAFLANFAPDGIALQPAPVRIATAWRDVPPARDPLATRLEWKPAQAGVAGSLDFGFTTGPYALSRAAGAPARHGAFFSVWQRSAAGRWQVLLDAGVASPGPIDFATAGAAPHRDGHARMARTKTRLDALRGRLMRSEADGFGAGSEIAPNAYARLLRNDARLYRNGIAPVVSRAAIAREIAQRIRTVSWSPDGAYLARSGDMAATYGRYREVDRDGAPHDGYYAHLWLHDRDGAWRLAYDVALPAR